MDIISDLQTERCLTKCIIIPFCIGRERNHCDIQAKKTTTSCQVTRVPADTGMQLGQKTTSKKTQTLNRCELVLNVTRCVLIVFCILMFYFCSEVIFVKQIEAHIIIITVVAWYSCTSRIAFCQVTTRTSDRQYFLKYACCSQKS